MNEENNKIAEQIKEIQKCHGKPEERICNTCIIVKMTKQKCGHGSNVDGCIRFSNHGEPIYIVDFKLENKNKTWIRIFPK